MRFSSRKLAAVGATAAVVGLLAGPAFGQTSGVNVTLQTAGPNGGRTLELFNNSGQTLSGLDLSSGTNSFVAKVVDSNYAEKGFTVQATMSNLYGFNSGTGQYTCTSKIPSSAVTMSSPGGLEVSGLGASVTPNYILSGALGGVSPLLTGVVLDSTNGQIQGVAQALTQGQLVGAGNTGSLFGSTLASLMADLPVQVSTPAGGPFTNPAADPSGASCGVAGANATPVTMMTGTANAAGLLSDFQALLSSVTGSASPTVTTLINDGYLDPNAVTSLLLTVTGLPLGELTPLLPSIENTLTGTLNSVTPLVSTVTSVTGNYSSNPGVAINTSGVPAGSYKGLMTITLMDS